MSKAWTDKKEYQLLSGELATSVGRDFEHVALPLIRIIWSNTVAPAAMGAYDRMGADHMVWSDKGAVELVVQYKGFKESEEELGYSQIKQCLDSIATFRTSGPRAKRYLLIHNRTGRNEQLRDRVERALQELFDAGRVDHAELWDRQRFLREAFNNVLKRVRALIVLNASSAQNYADLDHTYELLSDVPLELSELVVSPYQLVKASTPKQFIANPAVELLKFDERNLILMIGEAGFGKTTAALRTFESGQQVFYVPGASISTASPSTKAFLRQCINLDSLFSQFQESDLPTVNRILNPVVEQVLKERSNPLVLIIDGLDESIYFSHRGGLQWLFNLLRDVLVPVVLLARAEFWHARLDDFKTSIGQMREGDHRGRKIKLIELLPWASNEILTLTIRYRDALTDSRKKANIDQLIASIADSSYSELYGDIPARPLFLRFILDCVAERGIQRTGRAQLYYEWAYMKIARDVANPMRWGSIGRSPITNEFESAGATIRLAFRAMMIAAKQMTNVENTILELLPRCPLDEVLLSDEHLKRVSDPTGLFLNSLLIPASSGVVYKPLEIRFAHRAYQEFFLALYLSQHPDYAKGLTLPDSIKELLRDLATEGITVEF